MASSGSVGVLPRTPQSSESVTGGFPWTGTHGNAQSFAGGYISSEQLSTDGYSFSTSGSTTTASPRPYQSNSMVIDLTTGSSSAPQSPSAVPFYPSSHSSPAGYPTQGGMAGTPQLLRAPLATHASLPLLNEDSPRIPSVPPSPAFYGGSGAMVNPATGAITFDFSYGALHFLAGWKINTEPIRKDDADGSDNEMDVDMRVKRSMRRAGRGVPHFVAARHVEAWKRKRESDSGPALFGDAADHKRLRTS